MIETPAAAVAGDTLTRDVDFFSIGTNDLVQYTLAVDRGNANLAPRFTPLHPAVLRLIQRTVEVGDAGRHRSRRVRRDGVAAAHGVRAHRPRRAPAERRAALRAAREAHRARRDRGAREAGRIGGAARAHGGRGARRSWRAVSADVIGDAPFLYDGLPGARLNRFLSRRPSSDGIWARQHGVGPSFFLSDR